MADAKHTENQMIADRQARVAANELAALLQALAESAKGDATTLRGVAERVAARGARLNRIVQDVLAHEPEDESIAEAAAVLNS